MYKVKLYFINFWDPSHEMKKIMGTFPKEIKIKL